MTFIELLQAGVDWFVNTDPAALITYAIFGIGGSKTKSSSQSYSQDQSTSRAEAYTTQGVLNRPAYERLAFQAESANRRVNPDFLSQAAGDLFSGGTEFLDRLGYTDQGGKAGANFLTNRVAGGDQYSDQQIAYLGEDLGRFFREELLTGISRGSTAAGTQGGGRQGVAESLAAREVASQFARGATDIRRQDLTERQGAAETLLNFNLGNTQAGLAALPGLQDLAADEQLAEFDVLDRLSSILGGPTILSDSRSFSSTDSFGYSSGTSKGKSGGFSLGF